MTFWEWLGFENPRDSPQPETPSPKEGLPEVTDNVRDSGQTFVFGRSNAGEQVDEKAAMQIPTVYACVRLLAESIAALPLHLYRVTDDNGNKEKARDHPLYKILYRQPNPEMTAFVFWETLMTHLLLWGNAYAQIVRDGKNTVLGLYPLLPENVEVDRDESGELYYIYHAYTDEVPGEQNKDIYFRRDEIFHVPGLGFNGLIGFSPIAMMKNSLGTSIAVDKYGSAFFKNGAQPSGVLEHPGVMKDPNRVRDNWEAAYGGAANAHRVAVLEEGMTYKPVSLPPEDSQFLESKQFSVTEICRIFRVPPHLVADLSHATFSNIEYQSLNFVMHSLTPWLVRIEQGIIKVANDVIDRLSRHHQKAGRIRLGLGYANGVTDKNGRTSYSHEITIEPTAERKLLIDHLLGIFHQAWSGAAVRNISVALSRLSDANTQQISLF